MGLTAALPGNQCSSLRISSGICRRYSNRSELLRYCGGSLRVRVKGILRWSDWCIIFLAKFSRVQIRTGLLIWSATALGAKCWGCGENFPKQLPAKGVPALLASAKVSTSSLRTRCWVAGQKVYYLISTRSSKAKTQNSWMFLCSFSRNKSKQSSPKTDIFVVELLEWGHSMKSRPLSSFPRVSHLHSWFIFQRIWWLLDH